MYNIPTTAPNICVIGTTPYTVRGPAWLSRYRNAITKETLTNASL